MCGGFRRTLAIGCSIPPERQCAHNPAMDDLVRQAMAKWPHVPHCFGWLGLDGRGQWYMRDDRAQAAGAFGSGIAAAKGSLLRHEKLIAFIQRNYLADDSGQWYFQNGPQRVYVELAETPWIWRVAPDGAVRNHAGDLATVERCLVDESGHLYLFGPGGFGLVHSQDMLHAADCIERGQWPDPDSAKRADLPSRFGFVRSPSDSVRPANLADPGHRLGE